MDPRVTPQTGQLARPSTDRPIPRRHLDGLHDSIPLGLAPLGCTMQSRWDWLRWAAPFKPRWALARREGRSMASIGPGRVPEFVRRPKARPPAQDAFHKDECYC